MKKTIGFVFLGLISISGCAEDWRDSCTYQICEAIIDVGSSGSRLYIYAHDDASIHTRHVLFTQKITPGLSTVPPEQIPAYLKKLIPQAPYQPIPIYVYGTAGMRLIPEESQQHRYDIVKNWFKKYPTWQLQDARTISGQEEGIYAWVAAQTELNVLGKSFEMLTSVVEMGGASVQVNIPIREEQITQFKPEDIYKVHLNGQEISVWSKSFIGFGINEIEKKVGLDANCFSEGYLMSNGEIAHGDIQQCISHIEQHQDIHLIEHLQAYSALPVSEHRWVTLGAIRYAAQSQFYHYAQYFDLKHLFLDADEKYCHQSWTFIQETEPQDSFAYRGCLAASYIYAFLKDGMGIHESHQLYYPNASEPMDWTLGALILGLYKN